MSAVAKLARSGEQIVERVRGRLDERAGVLVCNHFRRARNTFGLTSFAKRSIFERTARSSCTV